LLTNDEIVTEVMVFLRFSRRGAQIVGAIESAIRAMRH
jgi:hypothetical protein